jgi:hypothetical protein
MWTPITRRQHSRDGLRYETDLTDAEWALIEPLLPEPNEGRPRHVLNAEFHPALRARNTIAKRKTAAFRPPLR